MRIVFYVLPTLVAYSACFGQESRLIPRPETGTLNVLLANKRGYVVAADSRRTQSSNLEHWDDSQKLFRAGPKCAMAIAGFASWAARGSPLDIQVAAFFRHEFGDPSWTSGKRSVEDIQSIIQTTIGYELQLFGALFATDRPAPRPEGLDFQTLAAGINKQGKIQTVRTRFSPRIQPWGVFDLPVPVYDMKSDTIVVDHFVSQSAGIDGVAQSILNGTFQTNDDRILNYYRARTGGNLDQLPLEAMKDLAIAILAETKAKSQFVGGPDQVAVFDRKGHCLKWVQPPLATDKQPLLSTILNLGFIYAPNGLTQEEHAVSRGKPMSTNLNIALSQPFEEPLRQVFVGGFFRGVGVSLDGNVFAGNQFNDVTFKYQGGPLFFENNPVNGCVVEFLRGSQLPSFLKGCTPKPLDAIKLDSTVGSPVHAQPRGCVSRNAAGRVVVKTKGRQHGRDCKGSGIVVAFQPLGPRPNN